MSIADVWFLIVLPIFAAGLVAMVTYVLMGHSYEIDARKSKRVGDQRNFSDASVTICHRLSTGDRDRNAANELGSF